MAIPSYVGGTLNEDVNTFGDWFTKTNLLITDMGTKVVSAEANTVGASTTGNVAINGILSANTLVAVDELRGGTVNGSDLLTISSNTSFTGATISANVTSFTVSGNTFVVSSNVATYSGNTVTYNSGNTNFNGTNVNFNADDIYYNGTDVVFSSNTVTFSGTNLNITANTDFSANTITMNNLVINDTLTLGASAELLATQFNFGSDVTFNANVTATNIETEDFTANTTTINSLVINDTLTLGASAELLFTQLTFGSDVTFSANVTATNIETEDFTANNITVNTISATGDINFDSNIVANNVTFTNVTSDTANIDSITANTVTATDFNSTSDIKLKENVLPIGDAILTLNLINPVSFDWKETGNRSYGVIAQELEAVLPELVREKEDGIKTVAYTQLIAFLISAIQEQQKEIDHIKSLL